MHSTSRLASLLALTLCVVTPLGAAPPKEKAPPAKPAPTKPAPAPAPAPTAAPAPATPPVAAVNPAATRPTDVLEPAAKAILDRAEKVAMDLKGIDVVTQSISIDWSTGQAVQTVSDEPCRVIFEFKQRDQMHMPKMRLEAQVDGAPRIVVVFDGKKGLRLDLPTKQCVTSGIEWMTIGGDLFGTFPAWVMQSRNNALLRLTKQEGTALLGLKAAAQVVGTETIDGELCDIVMSAIDTTRYNEDPTSQDAIKRGSELVRIFETAAFARSDGLPRRLTYAPEIPGQDAGNGTERVTLYSKLKLMETVDPALFSTAIPEGFTLVNPAPPAPAAPTQPAPPSLPEGPVAPRDPKAAG